MPHVSIDNFSMFYDTRGEGDAVVFIHGGFPSIDMHLRAQSSGKWTWETDFTSGYRFIAYDRRGCWRSACPESGYDLENQVRDLSELLDHLGVEEAHVIGSSAGGPIAILFSTMYPERVKTLVLAGTATNLWPEEDPITRIVREQLKTLEERGAAAAWESRPEGVELSLDVLWEREEMAERGVLREYEDRIAQTLKKCSLQDRVIWYQIQLQAIAAYLDRDLTGKCARITAPTHVVHGSKDREVPVDWGRDLAAKIPGATFRMYSDESHSLVHRCVAVRKDIITFYQQNGTIP